MKIIKRSGFTLIDTLVGLVIICMAVTLYFEMSQVMNNRLRQSNHKLMETRRIYEFKHK
ncbi:type II secretion system protein [Fructilactobacillus frigidiflavus]|uniref:type II secretion system protein n=1 Tax=Fructilactobacillus frigidiflavus TaxID=3242688 RepID=UPI003756A120